MSSSWFRVAGYAFRSQLERCKRWDLEGYWSEAWQLSRKQPSLHFCYPCSLALCTPLGSFRPLLNIQRYRQCLNIIRF